MPSKDLIQRFEDILANIVRIEEFTVGMDSTAFGKDAKTCDATERCLQRISEAAKKLGTAAEELCPGVAWPSIRGLGNILRHEYDRVDISRGWLMVEDDLPRLKAALQSALRALEGTGGRS